jgi:hypothetical protein
MGLTQLQFLFHTTVALPLFFYTTGRYPQARRRNISTFSSRSHRGSIRTMIFRRGYSGDAPFSLNKILLLAAKLFSTNPIKKHAAYHHPNTHRQRMFLI